jgi:hypothetical protein
MPGVAIGYKMGEMLSARFPYECVLLREGQTEAVSPRVFPNLRRTHEYENLPLHKQLSFYFLASFLFHRKEIFPWEHGNT